MIWLAVDPGKRRLGLAISDELGWVHPLATVERKGGQKDVETIGRLAKQYGVGGIVVGLPLNMDGSEGDAARSARNFAKRLEETLGIEVRLQDERLSSFEAESRLKEAGVKIAKKRWVVDQMAAVIILEDFLAGRERK